MAFNKNPPPWSRNTGNISNLQTMNQALIGFPQNQQVFGQNMGMQQQQLMQMSGGLGMQGQMYNQSVQYPQSRGAVNQMAFSSQQSQVPQTSSQSSKFNPNSRVFSGTGHVTKVQNDFGFIDEEVFFHKNVCVKGSSPKVGDRVLVEAAYNQNMPFKWNATRVQVLQPSSTSSSSANRSHAYGTSSSLESSRPRNRYSPTTSRKSPDRNRRSPNREARSRDHDESGDRRRHRDETPRDSNRERSHREKREYSPEVRRDRSPVRKSSPKRRKTRPIPRYMVQIPKFSLALMHADVLELRHRYTNMYVPSDFITTNITWMEAFPPNAPFSIQKPCSFHVMHKDLEPLQENDSILDPPDADYLYSAKVMLMSTPALEQLYGKCFASAEEKDRYEDDFEHPTRIISFLVGVRGKNEAMAIGGPWSPSLDGQDPRNNPNVLINTAIRTCRALTGIDLSKCSHWYRFVELYYRRSKTRVEAVTIFLPDIRSLQPTRVEWDEIKQRYRMHLDRILYNQTDIIAETTNSPDPVKPNNPDDISDNKEDEAAAAVIETPIVAAETTVDAEIAEQQEESDAAVVSSAKPDAEATTDDQTADDKNKAENKKDKLDVNKMTVADLKAELTARNESTKGTKPQLKARYLKLLKQETLTEEILDEVDKMETEEAGENVEEDIENVENIDLSQVTVIDEYDAKSEEKAEEIKKEEVRVLDERERHILERRYTLPEHPSIIVHPSKEARAGKFDCSVMSLSLLLDYGPDDNKEHLFEVSLFAELFNEMLMRDFGFNIYKALCLLPEKVEKKEPEELKKDDEESSNSKEKEKSEDEKSVKEDRKDRDRERDRKRRHEERSDDDRSTKEKDTKDLEKERKRYVTINPHLLLSFVYFDVSHCGYIFEKDIEELFYTLGLNLSRSQTRKIASKAVTRDSLYYRKLTDKPKELNEPEGEAKIEEEDGSEGEKIIEIAKGNTDYIDVLKKAMENVKTNEASSEKKVKLDAEGKHNGSQDQGMIMHNGALLDINKLLEQMKRLEKTGEDTERHLVTLRKENAELLHSNTKANSKIKDLSADVKSLGRKLTESEQGLRDVNRKSCDYYAVLSSVYDRISPIFHRSDKRSSSISSSKRASSRERRREERSKGDHKEVKDDNGDKESDKEKEKVKEEADKDVAADEKPEIPSEEVKTEEEKIEKMEDEPVIAKEVEL